MTPSRPEHFCRCLERVVGLAAVAAEWRHRLRDDWVWARQLLRPTDLLAPTYPKLDGLDDGPTESYQVVWHDEDADCYVATRAGGDQTVELSREDLVVYELDRPALGRRVAAAMGVAAGPFDDVDGVPHAALLGVRFVLTSDETPVYAVLQAGRDALSDTLVRLAARTDGRFVVLTPTRSAWSGWPPGVRDRAEVVAIDEHFVVSPDGRWSRVEAPRGGTKPSLTTRPRSTVAAAGTDAEPVVAPPYVPTKNELVILRVLAKSKTRMIQADLVEATRAAGRPLSRRTIGPLLTSLLERELIAYPQGANGGAVITPAGRALAGTGRPASQ